MIRSFALAVALLLTGTAQAAETRKQASKAPEVLILERGVSGQTSFIRNPRTGKIDYAASDSGGSTIITDPRTHRTIAVLPREKANAKQDDR